MPLKHIRPVAVLVAVLFCAATTSTTPTTVDLQWAICDQDANTVLAKLGHEDQEPHKSNPITYYDTWPPHYTAKGLAFRTKIKKKHHPRPISLIKARFDEEVEGMPESADCVWDQYGNSTFYTCGLSSPLEEHEEAEPIWSDEQIAFAESYQKVDWEGLMPYGPFANPKWKLQIEGNRAVFDDVVASAAGLEVHLMEIEVEVESLRSERTHESMSRYLEEHGVVICELQLPKTLRWFSELERSALISQGGSGVP